MFYFRGVAGRRVADFLHPKKLSKVRTFQSDMKKSPVAAMSNIRDAVRRKSVGLTFTTNFSIFSRSTGSTGEDDRSEQEGDDDIDEPESSQLERSGQDSTPRDDDADGSPSPAVSSRNSYVEPPEPPLPPPSTLR